MLANGLNLICIILLQIYKKNIDLPEITTGCLPRLLQIFKKYPRITTDYPPRLFMALEQQGTSDLRRLSSSPIVKVAGLDRELELPVFSEELHLMFINF